MHPCFEILSEDLQRDPMIQALFDTTDPDQIKMTLADVLEQKKFSKYQAKLGALQTQKNNGYIELFTREKMEAAKARAAAKGKELSEEKLLTMEGRYKSIALENLLSGIAWRTGSTGAKIVSLERHIKGIIGTSHQRISDMMDTYRPKLLGLLRDRKGVEDFVRALMKPGDFKPDEDVIKFAEAWRELFQDLRIRANKAGIFIRELKDWNLAQIHNSRKIIKMGRDKWKQLIMESVDPARMTDDFGKPLDMNSASFQTVLDSTYDSIITNGAIRIEPEAMPLNLRRKLGDSHTAHRFFHITDPDKWLKYSAEAGADDVYQSMMHTVELMAREIGAAEYLGPNPDHVFNYLIGKVRQAGGGTNTAERTYEFMQGRLYNHNSRLAGFMRGWRNLQVGIKLGGAMLSALADAHWARQTAMYNGMPVSKLFKQFTKQLLQAPTDKEVRMHAVRLGLPMEYALFGANTASRFNETSMYGWTAKMADFTMRASGLDHWTHAMRNAFGVEMLGNLATFSHTGFDELPRRVRNALTRYGISKEDWMAIKASPRHIQDGVEYINPTAMDSGLASKVLGMVLEEMNFASPTPSTKIRAFLTGGLKEGTFWGEMVRSFGVFKTFPATILSGHFVRTGWEVAEGNPGSLGYLFNGLVGSVVMGTMVYNLREIAKGNRPETMEDAFSPHAIVKGFEIGSGADFVTAFLRAADSRKGLAGAVVGPMWDDGNKIGKFLVGNAIDFATMEKDALQSMGAEGARLLQSYNPLAKLWYTRMIFERGFHDQLNRLADPDWAKKQRSLQRKHRKEHGFVPWGFK